MYLLYYVIASFAKCLQLVFIFIFCVIPTSHLPFSLKPQYLVSSWQNLVIPFTSCAPFFASSPYPVNECPRRSLPFRFSSASRISIGGVSTLAFPFSFVSSLERFAFWRSASLVWKRASFNTPARAKQSASGSAVRFNYLAASQVVDAGWFTHFASNLYNRTCTDRRKFLRKENAFLCI